VTVYYYCN